MLQILKILVGLIIVWILLGILYTESLKYMHSVKYQPLRVAVCISGQLRSFKTCFESLNDYILKKFDTDVFLCLNADETPQKIQEALTLYNPKSWCKNFGLDREIVSTDIPCGRIFNIVVHQISLCDLLRQKYELLHNFTYDMVIRIRPDIKLFHGLSEKMVRECQENSNILFTPQISPLCMIFAPSSLIDITRARFYADSITDQLFITSSPSMTQCVKNLNGKEKFTVENEFYKKINQDNNLTIKPFSLNYYIMREEGWNIPAIQFFYSIQHSLKK